MFNPLLSFLYLCSDICKSSVYFEFKLRVYFLNSIFWDHNPIIKDILYAPYLLNGGMDLN